MDDARTVVDCCENSPMLGVHQFCDQQWGSSMGDSHSKSDQESSSKEHPIVGADALQDDAQNPARIGKHLHSERTLHVAHYQTANYHTQSASKKISSIWHNRESNQRPERHNGTQNPKERACRMMEVVLPMREGLETVHHRAIVSIRSLKIHATVRNDAK